MASAVARNHKTIRQKNSRDLFGGQRLHETYSRTETSTSSTIGRADHLYFGKVCRRARSSSNQSVSTSLAISFACSKFLPKVTQPGKSGKETAYLPFSAGEKTAG